MDVSKIMYESSQETIVRSFAAIASRDLSRSDPTLLSAITQMDTDQDQDSMHTSLNQTLYMKTNV